MNTKLLSEKALSIIDQYQNFSIGSATCSIPYYNNRHLKARAKLGVQIGKGSPKDIYEEIKSTAILEKVNLDVFTSDQFKIYLNDHSIGIDCSGLAYAILNAESDSRGKGTLDRHLSFPFSKGILGKIRSKIRPVENSGVTTFAHDENSLIIPISEAQPGDMITMTGGETDRDHILVLHQIEYQNFIPTTLHYTHAIAWPTDGEYGHGVRQGTIDILDPNKPLTEQRWTEQDKTGEENYTFTRAVKSTTSLRRLRFL